MPATEEVVVAEGGLLRIKELGRELSQKGFAPQILPPANGCHGG